MTIPQIRLHDEICTIDFEGDSTVVEDIFIAFDYVAQNKGPATLYCACTLENWI